MEQMYLVAGSWVLDESKLLAREELTRLWRHVRGRVERARFEESVKWREWFAVELAFESGLRVMEMAALNCDDLWLRLARPIIYVRNGKCGKARPVRIRKEFVRACEDFLNWKLANGESIEPGAPVFLSPVTGRHLTTRALQKMFERCCKRTNIVGHSIHHARHTHLSNFLAATKDLRATQRQGGHADLRTTQTYLHVLEHKADGVERLYA